MCVVEFNLSTLEKIFVASQENTFNASFYKSGYFHIRSTTDATF